MADVSENDTIYPCLSVFKLHFGVGPERPPVNLVDSFVGIHGDSHVFNHFFKGPHQVDHAGSEAEEKYVPGIIEIHPFRHFVCLTICNSQRYKDDVRGISLDHWVSDSGVQDIFSIRIYPAEILGPNAHAYICVVADCEHHVALGLKRNAYGFSMVFGVVSLRGHADGLLTESSIMDRNGLDQGGLRQELLLRCKNAQIAPKVRVGHMLAGVTEARRTDTESMED
ncbi:uncharacterized protein BDZ99DRAFT_526302 [Mytilinidion resinicola]|uniref:Uncharacterized protein n=1 Tax=Mytilinidion resinicola TaxID=574789 RepID=A0A6A6Y5N1_9PEZI|nr:uncharacterized protein BDZ99DRAFT_526302 [Mytilinidion resinicola]KAF2803833.1 hypothetical protein BDZ99DRAFT_526302 [Mytilinidion resinicola]